MTKLNWNRPVLDRRAAQDVKLKGSVINRPRPGVVTCRFRGLIHRDVDLPRKHVIENLAHGTLAIPRWLAEREALV